MSEKISPTPSWNALGFRNWLNDELAARGWKPIDLARRMNPDSPVNAASSISKWMHGKRQPDTASCRELADLLGADLDHVLMLAGHRPAEASPASDPKAAAIEEITSTLKRLPESQVRSMSTMVRALLDEATRPAHPRKKAAGPWARLSVA